MDRDERRALILDPVDLGSPLRLPLVPTPSPFVLIASYVGRVPKEPGLASHTVSGGPIWCSRRSRAMFSQRDPVLPT